MERFYKKITLFLIIVIAITSTSGCWQDQDIEKMSIVAAVGVDKLPNEMVEITLQIVKTDAAAEAGGGGPSKNAVWVYSTTGKTVFEAIRNQLKAVNKRPFFGHNQMIVIGEDMARSGLKDIIDIFERDPEIKLTPVVLIARGTTAKTLLNAKSDLEAVPIIHLRDILENFEGNPVIQKVTFLDLLQRLNMRGHQLTVGTTENLKEVDTKNLNVLDIKIEGSAAFKEDKLIGWLTPDETNGLQYIDNKVKSGVINISSPNEKDNTIAIEKVKSASRVNTELQEDELKIVIEIKARGNLGGQQGSTDLSTPEMLEVLEAECERAIKQKIVNAIKVAQKDLQSDIVGFGEIIRRQDLSTWKEIQEDWDEIFLSIPVEVNVQFEILRTGLTNKPLTIQ